MAAEQGGAGSLLRQLYCPCLGRFELSELRSSMSSPHDKPWYADDLSTEQQNAVAEARNTSSILASAGSGKTRTLVYTLVNEILQGTPPTSIIAFTFTKKAAAELLTRVHLLLRRLGSSKSLSGLGIGTIHSWCLQFLLDNSSFYNFDPIEEDIRLYAFVERLYDELGIEQAYNKPFPNGILPFLRDVDVFYNESLALTNVPVRIQSSFERFLAVLKDNRLVTFGGMIQYAIEILTKEGPIKDLRYIYVDEYQDVNPAQVALIHAMAPPEAKVIVVGDDLQSIYNWRGSDVTKILDFQNEFNASAPSTLTENYRSRPALVNFSNAVAENINRRYPKAMDPKRPPDLSATCFHQSFSSESEQAETIAQIVLRFHEMGVPYNKIAILLRSVRGAGKPIVAALEAAEIAVECPTLSRGGAFLEEFIIPIFDWLKDEHLTAKNEEEEKEQIDRVANFWHAVRPWLPEGTEQVFWQEIHNWLDAIDENDSSAYDVRGRFYNFLHACGVSITEDEHELTVSLGIATQIIRAVEEIQRRRLRSKTRKRARQVMRDVFFSLIKNKDTFGESLPVNTTAEGVLVTTVHQAKGLEWPVVIVPTLNKNRFPLRNDTHSTSFPGSIAVRYGTSEEDEWRLFYVACTRARERLFLFDFGNSDPQKQSVFVRNLANHLVRKDFRRIVSDEIFRIDQKDLQTEDPPPVRIGLSDLLLYFECPFQFALRRVSGIQPSIADDLGYGKSIHELIQRRYKDEKNWDDAELENQIDKHVHLPYVGENQLAKSKVAIKARMRGLEAAGAFTGNVEPELRVEVPFDDGVVDGTIDGVVATQNGLVVRDWKTNIHHQFIARYASQVQFYCHALREIDRPVCGAELIDVGATQKEGKLVSVQVDASEPATTKTVEKVSAALHGIKYQKFQATPSPESCGLCDMQRICGHRVVNA